MAVPSTAKPPASSTSSFPTTSTFAWFPTLFNSQPAVAITGRQRPDAVGNFKQYLNLNTNGHRKVRASNTQIDPISSPRTRQIGSNSRKFNSNQYNGVTTSPSDQNFTEVQFTQNEINDALTPYETLRRRNSLAIRIIPSSIPSSSSSYEAHPGTLVDWDRQSASHIAHKRAGESDADKEYVYRRDEYHSFVRQLGLSRKNTKRRRSEPCSCAGETDERGRERVWWLQNEYRDCCSQRACGTASRRGFENSEFEEAGCNENLFLKTAVMSDEMHMSHTAASSPIRPKTPMPGISSQFPQPNSASFTRNSYFPSSSPVRSDSNTPDRRASRESSSSTEAVIRSIRASFEWRGSKEFRRHRAGYDIFTDEVERGFFLADGETIDSAICD
jgi:hypothetical protein